jgi:endonuclease-3 related protein
MAPDPGTVFRLLLAAHGRQHWWPARTRFEVFVGAMLMARTPWRRVEEAMANLRRAGLRSPIAIARAPLSRLRRLLRPAGLHTTKPERLRDACRAIARGGGLERYLAGTTSVVRDRLRGLAGVGDETADTILLYAARRPVFVVDAYTRRIGERLGWFSGGPYAQVQGWFQERVPADAAVFNEYHALLVAHGKAWCRARPRCAGCPLLEECRHGRAQVYPEAAPSSPP